MQNKLLPRTRLPRVSATTTPTRLRRSLNTRLPTQLDLNTVLLARLPLVESVLRVLMALVPMVLAILVTMELPALTIEPK